MTKKTELRRRKSALYGKGINDADYVVCSVTGGVKRRCHYYNTWSGMLTRAYCPKYKSSRPTYEGVSVCEEWLTFSTFKKWMENQNWEGMHLDKDIIKPGNKEYSPETCSFITPYVNSMLGNHAAARGKYPIGVTYSKGRYIAKMKVMGKTQHIGCYATVNAAFVAYKTVKYSLIRKVAGEQVDQRVSQGLLLHADILANS